MQKIDSFINDNNIYHLWNSLDFLQEIARNELVKSKPGVIFSSTTSKSVSDQCWNAAFEFWKSVKMKINSKHKLLKFIRNENYYM